MTGRESLKALGASRTRQPPCQHHSWCQTLVSPGVMARAPLPSVSVPLEPRGHFTGSEDPQQAEIQPYPSTDEETRRRADPTVRTGASPVCHLVFPSGFISSPSLWEDQIHDSLSPPFSTFPHASSLSFTLPSATPDPRPQAPMWPSASPSVKGVAGGTDLSRMAQPISVWILDFSQEALGQLEANDNPCTKHVRQSASSTPPLPGVLLPP